MRTIVVFCLVICFSIGLFSCDRLIPVDYDKAGRDIMAIMSHNGALTISEYKDALKETRMSSKDFFTLLKNGSGSMSQFTQFLSLDMANDMIKELDIDVKNLKRALEE